MQKQDVITLLNNIKFLYDVVRLVDIKTHKYYILNSEGTDIVQSSLNCHDVWKRGVCENCISSKVVNKKVNCSKFESVDGQVYFVVAEYLDVDGIGFSLELVKKIENDMIFSGFGKDYIVNTLDEYNNKVYRDPLTHVYNRSYLEDHFANELGHTAIAMLDFDYLKTFNDKYGHDLGDKAIAAVVAATQGCVRDTDAVIRIGGDEFVIVFESMPFEHFEKKLQAISAAIKAAKLPDYPQLQLSVSIGGYYGCGNKQELIKHADEQLYKAKEHRGSVCVAKEHCCKA